MRAMGWAGAVRGALWSGRAAARAALLGPGLGAVRSMVSECGAARGARLGPLRPGTGLRHGGRAWGWLWVSPMGARAGGGGSGLAWRGRGEAPLGKGGRRWRGLRGAPQ